MCADFADGADQSGKLFPLAGCHWRNVGCCSLVLHEPIGKFDEDTDSPELREVVADVDDFATGPVRIGFNDGVVFEALTNDLVFATEVFNAIELGIDRDAGIELLAKEDSAPGGNERGCDQSDQKVDTQRLH